MQGGRVRLDGPISASATAWQIADPGNGGAISVVSNGVCALTSTGAGQTRTIAIPTFIGQKISIIHDTDGGDIAITAAAAINQAGNTIMTLTEVNDSIILEAMTMGGALRWRVTHNDGVVLT